MEKKIAVKELNNLAKESLSLHNSNAYSEDHTRWLLNVHSILTDIFGQQSTYYLSFENLPWREAGSFVLGGPARREELWDPQGAIERRNQEAYQKQLTTARGLLLAAVDEINRADNMENLYHGKNTEPESSDIIRIIHIAEKGLRKVLIKTPENERDVQDAFYGLLVGAEIEHSRETEHIEYSSKTYIPDFSFFRLDLVVEIKFCGAAGKEKTLIAEINDDIKAYSTKHGNLVFVIFDMGFMRDIERFKGDLEDSEGVVVLVVKK